MQNPNRVPYSNAILEHIAQRTAKRNKKERAEERKKKLAKRRAQTQWARKLGAGKAWVRDEKGRLRRIPGPNIGGEYLKSQERHLPKFHNYHLDEDSIDSDENDGSPK